MSSGTFEKYVSMLPVSWDRVLSEGLSFFISNQDPDDVEFEVAKNGYRITVKTDEQNAREAKEFWENHVHRKLKGGD